ncbi:MAG TPA: TonB family protein [Candidatus Binatia bacterium]|nr:TonB family protein [Candidatus Binatia bacterium]
MGHSPLLPSPGSSPPNRTRVLPHGSSRTARQTNSEGLLQNLRETLAGDAHTPEAVLGAAADTARILTGAHGVAIALRSNGLVVCRARSGEMAPDLGVVLSASSGLSGHCLRSSLPVRCDDAFTDARAEAEVCRRLGIRSVAAVPLRHAGTTVGILEAFSAVANAFGSEQIDLLQKLALLVEAVYARELKNAAKSSSVPVGASPSTAIAVASPAAETTTSSALQSASSVKTAPAATPSPKRRTSLYWIAAAVAALVLVSGVVWSSWRETVDESSPQQAAKASTMPEPPSSPQPKPSPFYSGNRLDSPDKGLVRKAARIEIIADLGHRSSPVTSEIVGAIKPAAGSAPQPLATPSLESPPTIAVADGTANASVGQIVSATPATPALDVRVSQGVTAATLIHRVEPVYPAQALATRVEGPVTLLAAIDASGSVGEVKILSGDRALAESAAAAVRQWRYSPTLLNGTPTAMQREITILFRLR